VYGNAPTRQAANRNDPAAGCAPVAGGIAMELIGLLQWPASAATLLASWLIVSSRPRRRNLGFWTFLVSNALWIAWALHVDAPALIALQVGLAAINVRGAIKTTATGADLNRNVTVAKTPNSS
jgi:hypothetical protein